MTRHVLNAGGTETCCGCPVKYLDRGDTASHRMDGPICRYCRAELRAHPQLVAAIAAATRSAGLRLNMQALRLQPVRRSRRAAPSRSHASAV